MRSGNSARAHCAVLLRKAATSSCTFSNWYISHRMIAVKAKFAHDQQTTVSDICTMSEDIFADDMFAVSDEEHHSIKPAFAPSGRHSPPPVPSHVPVHADTILSKRKADHEAEVNAASYKRLRSTGFVLSFNGCPQVSQLASG